MRPRMAIAPSSQIPRRAVCQDIDGSQAAREAGAGVDAGVGMRIAGATEPRRFGERGGGRFSGWRRHRRLDRRSGRRES